MQIKMNLLENSHDYLVNSFELYIIADESGIHTKDKSNLNNKAKWKLSFVTLVQSFELLLKYALFSINPILIYLDIDSKNLTTEKTVTYSVAFTRLTNLNSNPFSNEEETFIAKCFKVRNQFIHYDVEIKTEEMKKKFAKLYVLYKKGYDYFSNNTWFVFDEYIRKVGEELEFFANNLTIYRGQEIFKKDLDSYKAEIQKYSQMHCFITSNGDFIKRIAFGEENIFLQNENKEYLSTIYDWEYCDDCGTKHGEYHLPDCDLEVCPICHWQKLSCDCDISLPK